MYPDPESCFVKVPQFYFYIFFEYLEHFKYNLTKKTTEEIFENAFQSKSQFSSI